MRYLDVARYVLGLIGVGEGIVFTLLNVISSLPPDGADTAKVFVLENSTDLPPLCRESVLSLF